MSGLVGSTPERDLAEGRACDVPGRDVVRGDRADVVEHPLHRVSVEQPARAGYGVNPVGGAGEQRRDIGHVPPVAGALVEREFAGAPHRRHRLPRRAGEQEPRAVALGGSFGNPELDRGQFRMAYPARRPRARPLHE